VPSTNARQPTKGSTNADFYLVYFKIKNGQIATRTLFSGCDYIIQKSPKPAKGVTSHPKKIQVQKCPIFQKSNLGDFLLKGSEQLSSLIGQQVMTVQSQSHYSGYAVFKWFALAQHPYNFYYCSPGIN